MSVLKKIFFVALLLLVLTGGLLIALREKIAQEKFKSFAENFHEQTGGTFTLGKLQFNGLRQVELNKINILSPLSDTVFSADTVVVNISLWKLLKLQPPLSSVSCSDIKLNLAITDSTANYSFLFKNKKDTMQITTTQQITLADKAQRLWSKLMQMSDINFSLHRMSMAVTKDSVSKLFYIPEIKNSQGISSLEFIEKSGIPKKWQIRLQISSDEHLLSAGISSQSNAWLPFLETDNHPKVSVQNASLSIKQTQTDAFSIHASLDSLNINYWRIASETVSFPLLSFNSDIRLSENTVSIDSNSVLKIHKVAMKAGGYIMPVNNLKLQSDLSFQTPADSFFSSLPDGIFFLFKGFKARGDMVFNFHLKLDLEKPDSLELNSSLSAKNFKIEKYEKENFANINNTFLFDSYDGDRYVKSILVGKENPDFVSLADISHYLQYAVLTSEDPSFFYHRGFIEDAFRESMIENLKAKRFVRGGSTISMQLVKNVFLSREKTISRKLQEMLIVWLIENQHLVSKERMFEIYLNVIEWGPGIYGIKDAAHFYFDKTPAQLNLAESIYLAGIIPRPKYYKYSFDSTGNLKPYLASYYRIMTNRMLAKTWITPLDTFNLEPQVKLKGPALKYVVPQDSSAADTLEMNQQFELF